MIQTRSLSVNYNVDSKLKFPDLNLNSGENLLIIGNSGIGKTTLLHVLSGILKPTDGTVTINGTVLNDLNTKKLDQFRGQHIGLIFQQSHCISSLTVYENLKAKLLFSKKTKSDDAIDQLLNQLHLTPQKDQKPRTLSQGQLQRLSIAIGVICDPTIMLADEPTSSLDDDNCNNVIDLLQEQATKANANLIIITHDQRVKNSFQNILEL